MTGVGLEPKTFLVFFLHKCIGVKLILNSKEEQFNLKINNLLEKSHMKVKTDLEGSILAPLSRAAKFLLI